MSINKATFFKHQAQTTPHPIGLEITKAEGVFLYDETNKRYFDLVSGLAVANIGHGNPKVVEAIKKQVDKFMHVMPYGEFVQEPQTTLAKKLTDLLPNNLNTCYFVNSGAETVEAALKLAKRYTGRTELIACHKSYHGSTHGALSVTGNPTKRENYGPLLPEVDFITFNGLADLDKITTKTAGVIVETIQGDAGVRIPTKEYMKALRAKCTQVGALLILDEIQAGFGRTGTFFAFEQFDITPDILCVAKAMGGGMPIGSFITSREIMDVITHNPMLGHITTFGGHPVCCAAAVANIEVIKTGILKDVEAKGKLIKELLSHPIVKEIRQIGLMLAIDLENKEITQKVVEGCLEKGAITFWFLSHPASFRLAPPLTISFDEIKEACDIITSVFDEVN